MSETPTRPDVEKVAAWAARNQTEPMARMIGKLCEDITRLLQDRDELVKQVADLQKSVADSVEHCQDGWRQAAMLSDEIARLKNGS